MNTSLFLFPDDFSIDYRARLSIVIRSVVFRHYMRKSGRSLDTFMRNVIYYPHPRRFNLILRSFIRSNVFSSILVSEDSIPRHLKMIIFKYFSSIDF